MMLKGCVLQPFPVTVRQAREGNRQPRHDHDMNLTPSLISIPCGSRDLKVLLNCGPSNCCDYRPPSSSSVS